MASLAKPTRLDRDVKKWQRQVTRRAAKTAKDRAARAEWERVSKLVKARDGQRCRLCGIRTTRVGAGDPRLWGHVHHIVFRSQGGTDDLENLLLLCAGCHADIHTGKLGASGTATTLVVGIRDDAIDDLFTVEPAK